MQLPPMPTTSSHPDTGLSASSSFRPSTSTLTSTALYSAHTESKLSLTELGAKPKEVAPFLKNLRKMLDTESDAILRWTSDGTAFEIHDMEQMMKHVLPKYFKHRKYTSFQRQLNYFNFRKWTKSKAVVCTFSNPFFLRDQPDLAAKINRKKSTSSASSSSSSTNKGHSGASKCTRPMVSAHRPALMMPVSGMELQTTPYKSSFPYEVDHLHGGNVHSSPSSNPWHHVDEDLLILLPNNQSVLTAESIAKDPFPSPTDISTSTWLGSFGMTAPQLEIGARHPLHHTTDTSEAPLNRASSSSSEGLATMTSLEWVDTLYPSLELVHKMEDQSFAAFAEPYVASGGDVYQYYSTSVSASHAPASSS